MAYEALHYQRINIILLDARMKDSWSLTDCITIVIVALNTEIPFSAELE